MLKILGLFFFILIGFSGFSQRNQVAYTDTVSAVRNFMQTDVYSGGFKLSKSKFGSLLMDSRKWTKRNRVANIILPAGPLISVGGIYLAYDAIKGIPKVYVEDGVEYPYVVRSLPKLLVGLAAFVGGLSLMESANETKANATNWYNKQVKENLKNKESAFHLRMGITNSGGIGLAANF